MPHSIRRLLAYYGLNLRLLRTWRLGRRALIRRLILTTLVAYVSLATAIYVVPGISASGPPTILAAVVAIALLNTLLRPVLLWLAIALGVVGLAVLATALQFVVILVVGALVPGFHVSGLSGAVEGALETVRHRVCLVLTERRARDSASGGSAVEGVG